MRLLNVETLRLESYHNPEDTPPYAILSHTWGDEEVLFEDLEEAIESTKLRQLESRLEDLESCVNKLKDELRSSDRAADAAGPNPKRTDHKSGEEIKTKLERTHLDRAKQKKGWWKFIGCCREAAKFGLRFVWIDTCCICKGDSSELSESINSMFAWYRDAEVCLAYLSDASTIDEAVSLKISLGTQKISRWFTRGWTLQELVAPTELIFYQGNWIPLGSRSCLADRIHATTKIPRSVLENGINDDHFLDLSIAAKMSWAAQRQTTRPEDRAYSLMGLFSVNMPILYGEGEQSAFFRLQTEIFRASGDHSIFAWSHDQFHITKHSTDTREDYPRAFGSDWNGGGGDLFASSPKMFAPDPRFQNLPVNITSRFDIDGIDVSCLPTYPTIETSIYNLKALNWKDSTHVDSLGKYSASSHGMRVQLLLEHVHEFGPGFDVFVAHLACKFQGSNNRLGIYLVSDLPGQHRRICPNILVAIDPTYHTKAQLVLEDVYITRTDSLLQYEYESIQSTRLFGFNGDFCVKIVNEELLKVGYKLQRTSLCKKSIDAGGTLLTFEDPLWWRNFQAQRHILLFGDLESSSPENKKSSIAVIWEIKDRMFQIGVEVEADVDRLAYSGGLMAGYLPMTVYGLSDKLKFYYSKRSKAGNGVIVAFRQTGGKIFLYVVIS